MFHTILTWLLVAAFCGSGLFNLIGTRETRESFVRWGYPSWWNWVTGGMEISSAILIAIPVARVAGLVLGTIVIVAAILTVVRHREFAHLVPLGVFLVLIGLVAFLR